MDANLIVGALICLVLAISLRAYLRVRRARGPKITSAKIARWPSDASTR